MKIIHIIYSLTSGGAERFVAGLSNEQAQMGHDVTVCMLLSSENETYVFNRRFLKDNVRFHSMEFSRGFSMKKVAALEKYLLVQEPDVVHCHLNVIPYVFRLALRDSQIRFIHTLPAPSTGRINLKIKGHRITYPKKDVFINLIMTSTLTESPCCRGA